LINRCFAALACLIVRFSAPWHAMTKSVVLTNLTGPETSHGDRRVRNGQMANHCWQAWERVFGGCVQREGIGVGCGGGRTGNTAGNRIGSDYHTDDIGDAERPGLAFHESPQLLTAAMGRCSTFRIVTALGCITTAGRPLHGTRISLFRRAGHVILSGLSNMHSHVFIGMQSGDGKCTIVVCYHI